MGKKGSVIVTARDIKNKVEPQTDALELICFKTQNVYLSSFLISQENFKLGRVYIEDLNKSNKAWIEVLYEPKYQGLFENYQDIYNRGKAIVNLNCYQQNIRFIMHLINERKSGLED